MVKGMVEPVYTNRGLCDGHMDKWHRTERAGKVCLLYGEKFKMFGTDSADKEFQSAQAEGDKRVAEWAARFKETATVKEKT